jgi:Ni,Fe-hydrogenase III small subunit/ferredoxin
MFKVIIARLLQGHRTMKFPDGSPPEMFDRFCGCPKISNPKCPDGCRACVEACPTDAISLTDNIRIDLGKCLFCADCVAACPEGNLAFTKDYRLAVRDRQDLTIEQDQQALNLATALNARLLKLLGRSLKLRQVSAGGCNACEADVNVLNTIGWDLGRFGIQFVASPRHADGLLITGPVTRNMELALKKTYDALPEPKIVIAIGGCAISGGPYSDHDQVCNGADAVVPVDLYIPGCPPHPLTILDGLLRLLGRIKNGSRFDESPSACEAVSWKSTDANAKGLLSKLRRGWRQLRPMIEEYQRETIEEQRHWGTRRAERELGFSDKSGIKDNENHQASKQCPEDDEPK